MNAFTIKDLENLSGIKAHTIRIWEQRYHFLNPQRTETNIRYYSNSELKTVLNIALLNKYGFKISHIDKMTADVMNEKILSLSQIVYSISPTSPLQPSLSLHPCSACLDSISESVSLSPP